MYLQQKKYEIKTEWGLSGIKALSSVTDLFIIVDVLSFSTSVDIALSRGAKVIPYRYKDNSAAEFAEKNNAILAAEKRDKSAYSLSPSSLKNIPANTKLVLPSPNGATLSLSCGDIPVIAGCLRNAKAAADYAMKHFQRISVIPAGEKWEDGSIRFAIEDLIGAGAIISYLQGNFSPESKIALSVYQSAKNNLADEIKNCISGRELIEKGFTEDVELACEINESNCVPLLKDNSYSNILEK